METFDFNKISDFDEHINLSIPQYDFVTDQIKYLVEATQQPETNIVDVGCSTGTLLKSLDHNPSCSYHGYDNSKLLPDSNDIPNVYFHDEDITKVSIPENTSVVTSIFTMQFLPIQKREDVIMKIFKSLNKGGCFIMCEKIHLESPTMNSITSDIYQRYKMQHFTAEEIVCKQQQLTGCMNLKTTRGIYEELKMFKTVETFWQAYGFKGFWAIK